MIHVDPVRLAQALANLLNNAAKYTPPRGTIRLRAECEPPWLTIVVSDTGVGIADELAPRIFDMFVQADHTSQASQGGLGIGLTLVRSFVELHGGTVQAASRGENQGSEFIVRLPLQPAGVLPTNVHTSPVEAAPSVPSHHRVLVVEDNPDGAQTLSMLLRALGNEVHAVADGFQAVRAVNEFAPDVILLDLGLPRMDGFEAARIIRQQPLGRDVKLIALTGWGQEEARRRSREAGCDHHLVKPVDLQALQAILADT
jgi:CheY-like chemotaxis protein